jgi:HK97 family phage portal protein
MVLSNIFRTTKLINEPLPAISRAGYSLNPNSEASTTGDPHINAMSQSGWLFAAVRVIASSLAGVEWTLYRQSRTGEKVELTQHPLRSLWSKPSEFYSQPEFMMMAGEHYAHVGEIAWIKIRTGQTVVQLQPVRPDRLRAIPSPTNFQSGWIYEVGQQKIPLEMSDVIFIKFPSPSNPYRGIGPIGSILHDLGSDREASQWTAQFFKNSAQPSGVIELDHELSDIEFDDLVKRWRSSHQGINNAHKVAVIENGHFVPMGYSLRDLELSNLRRGFRDAIIGSLGIHKALIGATDDVNRANAEASEVMYARWSLVPVLRLIRAGLNDHLASEFGDDLFFDFTNPIPTSRVDDLKEAIDGYNSGLLTLNQARRRLKEPVDENGDAYKHELEPAAPSPMASLGFRNLEVKIPDNEFRDDDELKEERSIESKWKRRLRAELNGIQRHIRDRNVIRGIHTKLDITDIDSYDWDWFEKYGTAVTSEIADSFATSMILAAEEVPLPQVQQIAATYARRRAGQLLKPEGNLSISNETRKNVRRLVANTIQSGESLNTLSKNLQASEAFNPTRAERIARTESATALGQGQKAAATQQGRNQKRWVTQGDDAVSEDICEPNSDQGWIDISESFSSGVDTIPGHPNCRCTVIYRTRDIEIIETVYCPSCTKKLDVNNLDTNSVATVYCRRCSKRWPAKSFKVIL